MCGSLYADTAFEILSNDLGNPSVDKILSCLFLVLHYDAISKFSRSFFLISLSNKYAYLLRMSVMDASKYKRSKSRQDWISFEYKRRVWWFLYIRNVIIGLNYGTIIKISSNDMAVNFPSNDYYFQNYNSDPSLKNYELTDCTKAINENKRDKRDEAYVLEIIIHI
ncbi:hypothetical protein AYI70_g6649 [Smittium culicis]|uniref:Xylanolytic transcriptional activator regulatory domain-containing protein n=1 Tax=Smittium culicis TaxID=133412 RepID=A0A1R1XP14_9FUNG|nr:hypothetical protein AYI70_g6649 [Smittium culicis]